MLRKLFTAALLLNVTLIPVHLSLAIRPASDAGFHHNLAWLAVVTSVAMVVGLIMVRN